MTDLKFWPLFLLFCLFVGSPAMGEDPSSLIDEEGRIAQLKSPAEFFGFAIGSRHLRHDQIVSYWQYLERASNRVQLIPYGRTHGARPLMVVAISSGENVAQLDALANKRRRLTSGQFQGDLSQELLVMYMGYSVHGDESSAVNAVPLVAYHLASSQSPEVMKWLDQSVFLIDGALNPDGVDRFANWANENRGEFPSPSALDREHVQPWPGGRTNYYWFDLNRDWLPLVHPESQGRLKLFHRWKPNVVLDFHEMSGSSSFFFQPGIPARNNPFSPRKNLELTRRFAEEHVARMDQAGELFYTEERFDDFYIGKGSTYPDLHGAVGILFEQGSTRGLKLKNARTDRHFRDTVANQVRMSLSSLTSAGQLKNALLQFQTQFYAKALRDGQSSTTTAYVLEGDSSRLSAAAQLLRRHAIDVYQPTQSITVAGRELRADRVLVIPCAQSEYTFIQSLMKPMQTFRENVFYDVSTWHLPSAFDLNVREIQHDLPPQWLAERWSAARRTAISTESAVSNDPASNFDEHADLAGYIVSPLELDAPRVIASLMQKGAHVRVTTEHVTTGVGNGKSTWPLGSYLILRQPNSNRWQAIGRALMQQSRSGTIQVEPVESGMTVAGPDLGSDTVLDLQECHPLLVVGSGTRAYSAGALWHFLDHRLQQPATLVDAARLGRLDVGSFSCVILPEGTYDDWGSAESEQLEQYARGGGTVIAVGSAIKWLARRKLIELGEMPNQTSNGAGWKSFGNARTAAALESVAGAFLQTQVDLTHPLAYGLPDASVPVFRDHSSWFALPENSYQLAAKYDGVIAGYVSQRNRQALSGTAAAWVDPAGSGRFILLADNPVFRGYVRSSERFLTNAILIGPSLRIPSQSGQEANAAGHHHESTD